MSRHGDSKQLVAAVEALAPVAPLSRRDLSRPGKTRGVRAVVGRALAEVSDHGRAETDRAGIPIMGVVGPNGGGKTSLVVRQALRELRAGRRVLSNLMITKPDGSPWEGFQLLRDFDQLTAFTGGMILLDEIVASASSRQSSSLPFQVEYKFQTLRHDNCTLWWTAPSYARADKMIREVTQGVTECRGYLEDSQVLRGDGSRDATPLWAPKRLFRVRTYDALDFDEWSTGKRDKLKPVVREWWWGVGSEVFASYDTLASVERVAESNESGRCLRCGGTRRPKPCRCGVGHEHEAA